MNVPTKSFSTQHNATICLQLAYGPFPATQLQLVNWMSAEVVVNLKKSKTECVLYRTHQRTSESKPMEIIMSQTNIKDSDVYEYLGVRMDRNLTVNEPLEKNNKNDLI